MYIYRDFEAMPNIHHNITTADELNQSIQYASILMKSDIHHNKYKSIDIFQNILNKQDTHVYRLTIEELSYVLYQLALVYYSINRYEDSRKCCEELIGINPDDDRQVSHSWGFVSFLYCGFLVVIWCICIGLWYNVLYWCTWLENSNVNII